MAKTGNQTTCSFSASSFSPSYVSLGGFDLSREALDDTALSNSTFMSKVPDDLVDIAPMSAEFYWDETVGPPPIHGTSSSAQTITITYGTSETLTGSGFWTSVSHPEHVNSTLRRGTYEWQFDGKTGPTYTATT